MSLPTPSEIQAHGWTPMPRRMKTYLAHINSTHSTPISISSLPRPSSPLATRVQAYAERELPVRTFNHSMRVYYFGCAIIKQHFPALHPMLDSDTYFLACMLHDIGTAPQHIEATGMSFEFYGGLLALRVLREEFGGSVSQAESVCEAIIRHQDLGETGKVQSVEAVLQMATVLDNIGMNPELVHKDTIKNLCTAYPRMGWSGCFAETIRKEEELKPWCHTTVIENFAEDVENNKVMEPYD